LVFHDWRVWRRFCNRARFRFSGSDLGGAFVKHSHRSELPHDTAGRVRLRIRFCSRQI
jgi:hypothetical protein